jgi:hypothetical protein
LINRLGFNNCGAKQLVKNLETPSAGLCSGCEYRQGSQGAPGKSGC